MGAWGAGLFQEDFACDVRDAYRELLEDGKSGRAATKQLLRDFKGEIDDDDDGPIFWLALAATQWQFGRLESPVKTKALKLIENGLALERWAERDISGNTKRRGAVLEKLRKQLSTPQPAEKKVRKPRTPFIDSFEWPVGGVFAYRLGSGKLVLFHVVDREWYDSGGHKAIFSVLDWIGDKLPSSAAIRKLPHKGWKAGTALPGNETFLLAISRKSFDDPSPDRIQWLTIKRPPRKEKLLAPLFGRHHLTGGYGFADWRLDEKNETLYIDARLLFEFGWK